MSKPAKVEIFSVFRNIGRCAPASLASTFASLPEPGFATEAGGTVGRSVTVGSTAWPSMDDADATSSERIAVCFMMFCGILEDLRLERMQGVGVRTS